MKVVPRPASLPGSYREQPLKCCHNCKHRARVHVWDSGTSISCVVDTSDRPKRPDGPPRITNRESTGLPQDSVSRWYQDHTVDCLGICDQYEGS